MSACDRVGEGELEQQIKDMVAERGLQNDVIFTGARGDVAKLYSVMDVFCLPSRYEGLPVVALEAQANGLPTLFSDKITSEARGKRNCRLEKRIPDIRQTAEALRDFYVQRDKSWSK